jgi:hypothetical protein
LSNYKNVITSPANNITIEDFCFELNKYLQNRFDYKRRPASVVWGNKINARRAKFDLYLRYRLSNKDSLVIARIYFNEERKGHGTHFLKFICKLASVHDIKQIIIECPNENSLEFGRKLGFTRFGYSNLSISTEDLILNLKNRD